MTDDQPHPRLEVVLVGGWNSSRAIWRPFLDSAPPGARVDTARITASESRQAANGNDSSTRLGTRIIVAHSAGANRAAELLAGGGLDSVMGLVMVSPTPTPPIAGAFRRQRVLGTVIRRGAQWPPLRRAGIWFYRTATALPTVTLWIGSRVGLVSRTGWRSETLREYVGTIRQKTVKEMDAGLLQLEGDATSLDATQAMPSLVIVGSEDPLVMTPSELRNTWPWMTVETVEGGTHSLLAEEPGLVWDHILGFVDRVT